jgi:hypothetical protein
MRRNVRYRLQQKICSSKKSRQKEGNRTPEIREKYWLPAGVAMLRNEGVLSSGLYTVNLQFPDVQFDA